MDIAVRVTLPLVRQRAGRHPAFAPDLARVIRHRSPAPASVPPSSPWFPLDRVAPFYYERVSPGGLNPGGATWRMGAKRVASQSSPPGTLQGGADGGGGAQNRGPVAELGPDQ